MFNIENWSQIKLKIANISANIISFLLMFIVPVVIVIINFNSINSGLKKTSFPFVLLVICGAIILAGGKFLSKKINAMGILNLDGTYNKGKQFTKHIIQLLTKAIVPVTILIISLVFTTVLKDKIDFYVSMIIEVVIFYIIGLVIDRGFIAFLDDEIKIREKVAEANAVSRRQNLK